MITIFNRRELINTFSMAKQPEICNTLKNNKIHYTIKTVNRNSPSALHGSWYDGKYFDFKEKLFIRIGCE